MARLSFTVHDVVVVPQAAAPQLTAILRIDDMQPSAPAITAVGLRCTVIVESALASAESPSRPPHEREAAPEILPWMQCGLLIQGFAGATEVEMTMPVTYDFDVLSSRLLHGKRDGVVPLLFDFSGTVFVRGRRGHDVEAIPTGTQARHAMPVAVWRRLVESYYPDSGWVRLDHDTMAALARVKESGGHETFDQAVWSLLIAHSGRVGAETPGTAAAGERSGGGTQH